jgi:methylated-DNA-[protein]-cysteine S-methyltransferase
VNIHVQYFHTAYGALILGAYDGKLCLCDWRYRAMRDQVDLRIQQYVGAQYEVKNDPLIDRAKTQIEAYIAGDSTEFDLPLLLCGSTFQQRVWEALLTIPYGVTWSYLQLSQHLGDEKAIRAVASANGANAISIIVPCHRIIGADGKLVGYAGGLPAKKKMLLLENAQALDQTGQLTLF